MAVSVHEPISKPEPATPERAELQFQREVPVPQLAAPRGLQRKCACGGSAGSDEECAECQSQRLSLKSRTATSWAADASWGGHDFGQVPVHAPLGNAPFSIQRSPEDEGASSQADSADGQAATADSASGLIVEDDAADISPGQMRKSDFLEQLRAGVCAAADDELAAVGRSAEGCPYIERAFERYRTMSGTQLERGLRRYAPDAAGVTAASDYIPIVSARVRRGVNTWARTGEITEVPEELAGDLMGDGLLGAVGAVASAVGSAVSSVGSAIGSALSSIGSLFFKAREGGTPGMVDARAVQGRLGTGESLDGAVKARMESVFGHDFSRVRVHRDGRAAELSSSLNARAFAMGEDVAFGSGEYRPGTPMGDVLIAHELAHVVQQGTSSGAVSGPVPVSAPASEIEQDADRAAVAAAVALWSHNPAAKEKLSASPRRGSGLQLQRCAHAQEVGPTTPQLPTGPMNEPGPVRPMAASQDPSITTDLPIIVQDCGNAFWHVKFHLPAPAATSGWFVQHIVFDRQELKADGTPQVPATHIPYWEAFVPRVEQNGVESGTRSYDDEFSSFSTDRNTKGKTTWAGRVKFYEGTLPNTFERTNQGPAGSLPQTGSKPDFWNDTGTDHILTVTWDCTVSPSTYKMTMQRGTAVETIP